MDMSDPDPPLIYAVCRPVKDGKSKKALKKTGLVYKLARYLQVLNSCIVDLEPKSQRIYERVV